MGGAVPLNPRSARNTGGGVTAGNGYNPQTGYVAGHGQTVPTPPNLSLEDRWRTPQPQQPQWGDAPRGVGSVFDSDPRIRAQASSIVKGDSPYGFNGEPNPDFMGPVLGREEQFGTPAPSYFDNARKNYQTQTGIYGSLAQSQYGPQFASLGQQDALIRQMMGLGEAGLEDTLGYLDQERGFNRQEYENANRGTGITLGDINRRRGFAGRDLGITNEDIGARRGFAGRERDLERESIGTQRNRLNEGFNMDNILLNSEVTPRGAFTSNLANTRRGSLSDRLTMDLADQDTRWSRNDLSFDSSMRNLLTQEQQARLGYDSTMSGLLTDEQMARLGQDKNRVGYERSNLGLDRQGQQARIGHITDQFNHYMSLSKNDSERAQLAYSLAGMLSEAGLPQSQIDQILGQTTGTTPNNSYQGRAATPGSYR